MAKKKPQLLRQGVVEATYPKLLLRNYRQWGDRQLALRTKEFGIWKGYTWKDCYDRVKDIFLGLSAIGLAPEDRVAILGDSTPEWFWCQLAIQTGRGTVVAINPAASTEKIKYVIDQSRPKFIFVQDQEQIDKLLELKETLPFQRIIYWSGKGLRNYQIPQMIGLSELIKEGARETRIGAKFFEEKLLLGEAVDVAVMLYMTGRGDIPPREVSASHDFIFSSAETVLKLSGVNEDYEYVSLMNPGWFFEQVLGFGAALLTGQKLNFAENVETAQEDFREISPHALVYPTYLWDGLAQMIHQALSDSSRVKRVLFYWLLNAGYKITDLKVGQGSITPANLTANLIANYLGFRPLRDKHGLDRVKVAYAAGGAVAPQTIRFFRSIGVNLKQIYATVEDGIVFTDPGDNAIEQQFG